MILPRTVCLADERTPLELVDLPKPVPGPGEILVRVRVCGVCHTELDEIEGRTAPAFFPIVLGHQIVGVVAETSNGSQRFTMGDRVGIGWIHSSTGTSTENVSPDFRATGRDVHGGYAEYTTVPERYAHPIPQRFSDAQAAPLLCAGAIGYRALRLANLCDGQRLGLAGFGASAHLVLQLSKHLFPRSPVMVFARDVGQREHARQLGAEWVGDIGDLAPDCLHAIIDTTPAWKPVVESLKNLCPRGRLVINAIRKEDHDQPYLQNLRYDEHLWMEKEIKTVANITGLDIAEFLPLAAEIPLVSDVQVYALTEANEAIQALRQGGIQGALVLRVADE